MSWRVLPRFLLIRHPLSRVLVQQLVPAPAPVPQLRAQAAYGNGGDNGATETCVAVRSTTFAACVSATVCVSRCAAARVQRCVGADAARAGAAQNDDARQGKRAHHDNAHASVGNGRMRVSLSACSVGTKRESRGDYSSAKSRGLHRSNVVSYCKKQ